MRPKVLLSWSSGTVIHMPTPTVSPTAPLRLTPTDVTRFVRLEQCERFLRFWLAERPCQDFMDQCGVGVQGLTMPHSHSGSTVEQDVEAELTAKCRCMNIVVLGGGDGAIRIHREENRS